MAETQKEFPISIGVRITPEMERQFRAFARGQGATVSELLRGAIRQMLGGKLKSIPEVPRKDL
jgi:hypothetical protein